MDFSSQKAQARPIYNSIGKVWCPALNMFVKFNAKGFHHLFYKISGTRSIKRTKADIERRVRLISEAIKVVAHPMAFLTIDRVSVSGIPDIATLISTSSTPLSPQKSIALEVNNGLKDIRVVILMDGLGEARFHSVMDY